MFRDKAFNLSILFSSMWHMFWLCAVGIVVTPNIQPGRFYQEVDFLGPILEKTAFDLMVEEVTPQAETRYAKSALFSDNIYLKPKGPGRKVLKEFIPDVMREKFAFSLRRFVKDTKEIPIYLAQNLRIAYGKTYDKAPSPFIEGPAGKREIIFEPAGIVIPRSRYGGLEEYIVRLKFFISGNGIAHDIEPVVSSGYPEVDLKAIRFLSKWRFSPSNLAKNEKADWGIITVRIQAE